MQEGTSLYFIEMKIATLEKLKFVFEIVKRKNKQSGEHLDGVGYSTHSNQINNRY